MSPRSYQPDLPLLEQYRSALVLGLGKTGYSVVRYLRKHGIETLVADTRAEPPFAQQLHDKFPEVKTYFGAMDANAIATFPLVVASPGLAQSAPELQKARKSGVHIIGDIELFVDANQQPLIAITGSNGKSTVTTLVGLMCQAAGMHPWVAGNIGTPALDALTDDISYDVAVLELSSFQLETTNTIAADAAAILNISADHMDRYPSMGDYLLAKARILRGARDVIIRRHDEPLSQITNNGNRLTFGLDEPEADNDFGVKRVKKQRWLLKGKQRLLRLSDVSLMGLHNIENVLAAFALIDFLQLPVAQTAKAVSDFSGLPHRMQTVAQHGGVTWVNDSKATNIGATATALKNLEQSIIWIAGGQGKGADFRELRGAISRHIKVLILFGEDAEKIHQALDGLLVIKSVKGMKEAVTLAADYAQSGDVVLLSPACASFDMYENFEQRGQDFSTLVQAQLRHNLKDDAA